MKKLQVILSLALLLFCVHLHSQSCPGYGGCTYAPLHYYTFDNSSAPFTDCLDSTGHLGTYYVPGIAISESSNPAVGDYARLYSDGHSVFGYLSNNFFPNGDYVNSKEYTFEFLVRVNSDHISELDFYIRNGALFRLTSSYMFFQAQYDVPGAGNTYNQAFAYLTGPGKLSPSYFLDKKWHHVACRFDGTHGSMQLWIDGERLSGLTVTVPINSVPHEPGTSTISDLPSPIFGDNVDDSVSIDIDEVAFYDKALPPGFIFQHFMNTKNGVHYACDPDTCLATYPEPCPDYSGCDYTPLHYFNFDGCATYGDCIDPSNHLYNYSGGGLAHTNVSPKVGSYAKIVAGSSAVFNNFSGNFFPGGDHVSSKEFTFEFLYRLNSEYFNELDFYIRPYTLFRLTPSNIFFQAQYKLPSSVTTADQAISGLGGTGVLSSSYYQDRNWHHIVCRFDGNSSPHGSLQLWIDGQLPVELIQPVTAGSMPYDINVSGNVADLPRIIFTAMEDSVTLDVDEIAFYDKALPADVIYQHYLNTQHSVHYDCNADPSVTAPSPTDPMTGSYDPKDFVPSHPLDGSGVPVTTDDLGSSVPSVLNQLSDFPLPRIRKETGLNQNINWMNNEYLGRVSKVPNATNDIAIQEQLASKWNYMFSLNPNAYFASSYQRSLNNFANTHSSYKYSISTNVNQISIPHTYDLTNVPSSTCPSTLIGYYAPNQNTKDYFDSLGADMRRHIINNVINDPVTPLTAPISYVSENGDENALFSLESNGCPYSDAAQLPLNLFLKPPGSDWQSYYGNMRNMLESSYRDEIIGSHALIPSTTKYSKYLVSSVYQHQYFEDYLTMRSLNTPFSHAGNNNYYSTPPFYITEVSYWRHVPGGTNWGWELMANNPYSCCLGGRGYEILYGDSLFAPFVSPGWTQENTNVRPGQWLGLLKGMGILGADYYHTGYFNVTKHIQVSPGVYTDIFPTGTTDPVDPRGWCYQAAIPAYAQGITSRFENFLHASSINYSRNLVNTILLSRRSTVNSNVFLVYGSLQSNSNLIGNTPHQMTTTIRDASAGDINGLTFTIRRQGNTYIYDKSKHLFYQLDKWHEYSHPSYWSKDFEIEAELNDYTGINNSSGINDYINNTMSLKTDNPSTNPKDFTKYDTYIEYASAGAPTRSYYYFEPRNASSSGTKNYYLWVRARSKSATSATKIDVNIKVTGAGSYVSQQTMPCISDTVFKWYGFSVPQGSVGYAPDTAMFALSENTEHEISFIGNSGVEFDKFIVSPSGNIPLGVDTAGIVSPCALSNRPTALNNLEGTDGTLQVYPNPGNGIINLSISKGADGLSIREARVMTLQGQIIYQSKLQPNTTEARINLSNCVNGIYILETTTSRNKTRTKIVIEK